MICVSNAQAQRVPSSLSDAEQRLSDEMKLDNEFEQIGCQRRPTAKTDGEGRRHKAFEAFLRQEGKIKIKQICGTIEGDPILSYLTVERGKASIVVDGSEDKFGPGRVSTYECDKLEIGRYFNDLKLGRMVFEKIDSTHVTGQEIALRCLANNIELIF